MPSRKVLRATHLQSCFLVEEHTMKFGIFYELQLPRPWAPGDEHRLYQNALDQVELADRLGYDHAWQVEHHFLEEYSHSPSPESFLAAASQRTKNIRLGHGIFQVTTNHPTRVAERVATLDLLSNGRCEFGMGESASITELEPFGVTMENKREIFEEAVRAIMPMFKDGPSEHQGKVWNIPLRMVVPKPLQKPHPPLWVACSQLQTLTKAGEWGMGALGFQFVSADAAHAWVHAYYNAFVKRQKKLADYKTNPQHRAGQLLHVRQDRRGGPRPRRRRHLLPVRAALLRPVDRPAPAGRRHGQHVGRIREMEEGQPGAARGLAARRPDRLAGHDPQAS
jgi:alkanesulfonate monooxygenase SsuD/methylene tetrahydromethanopterin reductase-like flavin-dependent oxidoreductase (luciferase family)